MRIFKRLWYSFPIRGPLIARRNEGKYTPQAYYSRRNIPVLYRLLSCGSKTPSKLFYQPIDEIRDYFGDETALYFAWLGEYTQALLWPAAYGFMTLVIGVVGGDDDHSFMDKIDPNNNGKLTLACK